MKKAALFLVTAIMLMGLCGCGRTSVESSSDSAPPAENYFGGEGELKALDGGYKFYDNDSIYSYWGFDTLKKYNQKTNTFSVACNDPGCSHTVHSAGCKARMNYCIFNGELIKIQDERIQNNDGTFDYQGYLYLCGEGEKQVFKNELPKDYHDREHGNGIGFVFALEDDYLVLFNGGYFYLLDPDFNIVHTVIGVSGYMGGVYYMNKEIYYIDNLYRLQKLDKESGEHTAVDLGSVRILSGVSEGNMLWFSSVDNEFCSYNSETGEVKVYAETASRVTPAGKYVEYLNYTTDTFYLYDKESGETRKGRNWTDGTGSLYFHNGVYYLYNYKSEELTLYEEDMSTVIKTATLM